MSETLPDVSAPPAPAGPWPADVVRTPDGLPAVLLVRTARGWTPLQAGRLDPLPLDPHQLGARSLDPLSLGPLPLVEAMTLADLVAEEAGAVPEPGRSARLAARKPPATAGPPEEGDPRDAEMAELRRTVGQLEHALAARVSIERAIGVLAERSGSLPRDAFDELRRRARAQGRPAQELAREVLDAMTARAAVPDQRRTSEPSCDQRPADGRPRPPAARRVTRGTRRTDSPGAGAHS